MSKKHYSEVYDIPLFNWEQVLDGKYEFMRKKRTSDKFDQNDIQAFYKLYNNYLKKYGHTDTQKKLLKLQEKYIKMFIKYAETDDAFILNQLNIIEGELLNIKASGDKGMTIGKTLIWLSKWMGGQVIDKRQITLEQFKDLIEEYERANEK